MVNLLTLPIGGTVSQSYQPQNHLLQNVPPYYNFNNSAFQKDSVKLSNKTFTSGLKKLSTTQKLLIGLGTLTSAAAMGIAAVRYRKTSALKDAQKVFQDVFMRNDITMAETKHMLQNYKNISKIKDKEEYIRAMFKEAKKNYGFEDADIPLNILEKMERSNGFETMGSAHTALEKGVDISLRSKATDFINTIHHELRHVKQHYISACYSKDEYFKTAFETIYKDGLLDKNSIMHSYKNFDEFYKDMQVVFDDCVIEAEKIYGSLNRANIKPEQYEFAKKCIENQKNYINGHVNPTGYFAQFIEKDAFKAGDSIERVLKKFI